jgi:hypothetical protein
VAANYRYLFFTLGRVPTPHQALSTRLKAGGGVEVVGQFAPQLGWANNEAAVLVRGGGDIAALTAAPLVTSARMDRLSPTLRPTDDAARPPARGIYVHRWFEVEADATDEFVALSGEAWPDFETEFDTWIFGLFRAETTNQDRANGVVRHLLITGYGDHGVWQASREPTTNAGSAFARRQQVTRRTWAASTRMVG